MVPIVAPVRSSSRWTSHSAVRAPGEAEPSWLGQLDELAARPRHERRFLPNIGQFIGNGLHRMSWPHVMARSTCPVTSHNDF